MHRYEKRTAEYPPPHPSEVLMAGWLGGWSVFLTGEWLGEVEFPELMIKQVRKSLEVTE